MHGSTLTVPLIISRFGGRVKKWGDICVARHAAGGQRQGVGPFYFNMTTRTTAAWHEAILPSLSTERNDLTTMAGVSMPCKPKRQPGLTKDPFDPIGGRILANGNPSPDRYAAATLRKPQLVCGLVKCVVALT